MADVPQTELGKNSTQRAKISRLLEDARARLVETGTRNRLIHVNRTLTRGDVLNFVNGRSDEVFHHLAAGKVIRFSAAGHDQEDPETDAIVLSSDAQHRPDAERGTHVTLKVNLGPDALEKKLLKISREAQTAEEESGVNLLYIALGFLSWYEDESSTVQRSSPLVLFPVELVRSPQRSTFTLRERDEDAMTNLPLRQRFQDDFGIEIPEIVTDEAWDPTAYFSKVDAVIASKKRWKVDPNGMQLGFFSFSKLLMYRDLDVAAWLSDALADNPLIRGLLYEGMEPQTSVMSASDRLDDVIPPDKLFHVIDADPSQAQVIEEVRAGRNLVVQGPPGTGKSQTITNMIATAVKDGKRVLFVAEKMAALSVVYERLDKVGLRSACLEIHSRSASKKAVLEQIGKTLAIAAASPQAAKTAEALRVSRETLNRIDALLHAPIGNSGETPFTVLGMQSRFIGASCNPPTLKADALAALSREDEARLVAVAEQYGQLLAQEDPGPEHPFFGVRNLQLQPVDTERLSEILAPAAAALSIHATTQAALAALGLNMACTLRTAARLDGFLLQLEGMPADASKVAQIMLDTPNLPRLRAALQAAADWRAAQVACAATFVDAAYQYSATRLRPPLLAGTQSFFAQLLCPYYKASRRLASLLRGQLPPAPAERLALVDKLDSVTSKRDAWQRDEAFCIEVLGDAWQGERTDFNRLLKIVGWCEAVSSSGIVCSHHLVVSLAEQAGALAELQKRLRAGLTEQQSILDAAQKLDLDPATLSCADLHEAALDVLSNRLKAIGSAPKRYRAWVELSQRHAQLMKAGLGSLAERLRKRTLDGPAAGVELRFARAETLWNAALQSYPQLRDAAKENRQELATAFAEQDRQRLRNNVAEIVAEHLARVPQGAQGEMGVIRGELGKKVRHLAIRRLFEKSGNGMQRIAPVLLMSPISVAQYLPPARLTFDLLIIDEASQVRPEDALGAIARARQIVVVGDDKQLPPSSFFDRLSMGDGDNEDSEDAESDMAAKAGDMESILTLCSARGLGSRMLKWHYRSRDPSLIEVSNRQFYDGALVLPPSPNAGPGECGLLFNRVEGVYGRGAKRDNRIEGEAIVARIAEHARLRPDQSLGVVTFSFAQRNMITELLELHRRADPALNAFLREGQPEDAFVKNIENVQGDERDVILISVGYGPATAGGRLMSMSFGPINSEGGERRLNVLFTRARLRCEVFASFDPGDIDLSKTRKEGPRILKKYLDFAKDRRLEDIVSNGGVADSPFEEDVAAVIQKQGFCPDLQVGTAGFFIDIGVRHPQKPGAYILAVECDGATYHSALWARERDRHRQEILEMMGWTFHRIWSTDWFYNRQTEIERLYKALVAAHEGQSSGMQLKGANLQRPKMHEKVSEQHDLPEIPEPVERKMPAYTRGIFPIHSPVPPHEAPIAILAKLVERIVEAEGPIHAEEVARRVAESFGKEKAGSRITAATRTALDKAKSENPDLLCDEAFWMTHSQAKSPPVRDRSAETGATLKASNIAHQEMRKALQIARDDNAGGSDADLIRTAARLMGFQRVGSELQARLAEALEKSSVT